MQVVINSLITAAELGILGVGLTITFSLLKFANFAHVEAAVLGAYLAFLLNVRLGWPFGVSLVVAALLMGAVGVIFDRSIFRRFREAGDVTPMIASLGLSIALRHAIQAVWGPQNVRYNVSIEQGYRFLGGSITTPQLGILAIVTFAMVAFHTLLRRTRIGKALRATSTNAELAQASGIDTERAIHIVWFIGTAFAAVGGILVAWDTQLDPYLGFNLVIPVFCVVLIGGVGSVYGVILGALVVGFAQNVGVSLDLAPLLRVLGAPAAEAVQMPVAYKPAIVYGAVIVLLLVRPSGLAGRELV